MVFAGGDDGDIALAYHHGFVTGCHGAGAVGNDEDLVTAVLVNLLRIPAPKCTMPKLKLLLSSGSSIAWSTNRAGEQGRSTFSTGHR